MYKGNYFDDLRHGYGEMYWVDGSYYKGNIIFKFLFLLPLLGLWEKGI